MFDHLRCCVLRGCRSAISNLVGYPDRRSLKYPNYEKMIKIHVGVHDRIVDADSRKVYNVESFTLVGPIFRSRTLGSLLTCLFHPNRLSALRVRLVHVQERLGAHSTRSRRRHGQQAGECAARVSDADGAGDAWRCGLRRRLGLYRELAQSRWEVIIIRLC